MVDVLFTITIAFSAFFVTLSFGLLLRYRQVSQRISVSNDLGRDLWTALEQRMKKQDERILDLMGRVEVIQLRFSENPPSTLPSVASSGTSASPTTSTSPQSTTIVAPKAPNQVDHVMSDEQTSQVTSQVTLDATELAVIRLLEVKPRSSVEIKELTGKSREHAARLMKELFDEELVSRDSSKKPFVYQLTDEGRKYLAPG